jgi:hypothetical protein
MARFLTACICYIILTLAIALFWNMVLFRDAYVALASNSLRPEPIIHLGLISVITEAVTLSLLFHFIFHRMPSLRNAVLLALSVGVFSMTYASFTVPAKFIISPIWQYISLELAFGLLHYGLAGIAFYFVFRNQNKVNVESLAGREKPA